MEPVELANRFVYHPPVGNQQQKYVNIRKHALAFAELLNAVCPDSRELSVAMANLEQCCFWANASIARNTKGE